MEFKHLTKIQELFNIARNVEHFRKIREQEQADFAEFLTRLQQEFDADINSIDAELKHWEGLYTKKIQDMQDIPPALLNFFSINIKETPEVTPEETLKETSKETPEVTPEETSSMNSHQHPPLRIHIINFLNKTGRALTSKEISDAFPGVPYGSITGRLAQLHKSGQIHFQSDTHGKKYFTTLNPMANSTPVTNPDLVTDPLQREIILFVQHRGSVKVSEVKKYFESQGFSKETVVGALVSIMKKNNPGIIMENKVLKSTRQIPDGSLEFRVLNLLNEVKGRPMNIDQVTAILGAQYDSCGAVLSKLCNRNKIQRVRAGVYKSL